MEVHSETKLKVKFCISLSTMVTIFNQYNYPNFNLHCLTYVTNKCNAITNTHRGERGGERGGGGGEIIIICTK